ALCALRPVLRRHPLRARRAGRRPERRHPGAVAARQSDFPSRRCYRTRVARSRQSRAVARRAERRRAERAPAPAPARSWRAPGERAVWLVTTVLFLGLTAMWLERQITWYLAVDQFGYLTFAHDLLAGHAFHQWAPLQWLARTIPPRTDMLAQAYVYDHGLLY